jgi:hypothetical protein
VADPSIHCYRARLACLVLIIKMVQNPKPFAMAAGHGGFAAAYLEAFLSLDWQDSCSRSWEKRSPAQTSSVRDRSLFRLFP